MQIVLGDRPIHITAARVWAALSTWERATLIFNLLWMSLWHGGDLEKELEMLADPDGLAAAFQVGAWQGQWG
jgi:pheromone shutdown protein TraB